MKPKKNTKAKLKPTEKRIGTGISRSEEFKKFVSPRTPKKRK